MCLNRIIQHHLGSSGDPSLPKSCHMLTWHETNSLALNGRGPLPLPSPLPMETRALAQQMDRCDAWRSAVVRRLVLGASARGPRARWRGSCLQQHRATLRWISGAGDGRTTRSTSSGLAVGSRLHVERKP